MNKVLRAVIISATATTAAAVAMSIINKGEPVEKSPHRLKQTEDQFEELDSEQTEALVAELAAQV